MFAIVDVSRRASHGQILMVVDDPSTAASIAQELNQRSIYVSVQPITAGQLDQLHAEGRAAAAPDRVRATA